MFKQAHTIKNNPAVLLGEIHPPSWNNLPIYDSFEA